MFGIIDVNSSNVNTGTASSSATETGYTFENIQIGLDYPSCDCRLVPTYNTDL